MLHLDPWNKVMVMAGAAAAVALTILMVVCFVGEGCLVYELITSSRSKSHVNSNTFSNFIYSREEGASS